MCFISYCTEQRIIDRPGIIVRRSKCTSNKLHVAKLSQVQHCLNQNQAAGCVRMLFWSVLFNQLFLLRLCTKSQCFCFRFSGLGEKGIKEEKRSTDSPLPPIKKAKSTGIDFSLPKSGSKWKKSTFTSDLFITTVCLMWLCRARWHIGFVATLIILCVGNVHLGQFYTYRKCFTCS